MYGKRDGYKFSLAFGVAAGNNGLMYAFGVGGTLWYFNPATIQKITVDPKIALVSFRPMEKSFFTRAVNSILLPLCGCPKTPGIFPGICGAGLGESG